MISPLLLTDPVVFLVPGERVDRYGNTVQTFDVAREIPLRGWLQHRTTAEATDDGDAFVDRLVLVVPRLPATAVPVGLLRVRLADGTVWEVDGSPKAMRAAYRISHFELVLRGVTGG
ncbi:hypothetical protein Lfu02_54970 [Longispora fulva]|uniref:Head-to-tail stopper n=1 Tax=Longispora fulva TaxID=619741 RepID=A0A8J7GUD0_9ACTN|nr:hypothetical protein [Longispora fulva]MBG6137521.1 hypothetical protein [Longispora fulva]GIG61125.1 hypothetical protein Lfu02_54970 [Longispora fulva]